MIKMDKIDFHKFNYIGSKYKLLEFLIKTIEAKTETSLENLVIGDLFSGTSICGYTFRCLGNTVISNDYEYYGYVIARAFVCSPYTKKIDRILRVLNALESVPDGLIYNNMSIGGNRMFFTEENAMKIDAMRVYLQKLKDQNKINEDEYYYVLTCILLAADKVANITSVYGAYLKKFKANAIKDIILLPIHKVTEKNESNIVYNSNINDMIDKNKYDVVYLDPPYNERQYSKNYHVLNYIALYDENVKVKGVTGLIENSNISLYCRKNEFLTQIDDLCKKVDTKWIFMSYSNEGLATKENIVKIMEKYGNITIEEIEHKRFKSNSNGDQAKKTIEYLFCLEKKQKKPINV